MKPLVLRGFARSWPAIERWKDLQALADHLERGEEAGEQKLVPIEVGGNNYMDEGMERQQVVFGDYLRILDLMEKEDLQGNSFGTAQQSIPKMYLAQYDLREQYPDLGDDIEYDYLTREILSSCGRGEVQRVNFWVGPSFGCNSPMHRDPFHNFFVQIRGHKSLLLCPEKHADFLELYPPPQKNTSSLDFASCNANAEVLFRNIPEVSTLSMDLEAAVIAPGDAVYIPKGYFHHFASQGNSATISVNFW
eukprot:CAMPEP_0185267000 /NCGR_PEP_ID=MMETSP1359-20130426/33064_1 /TAXON_ID=552665 /ORGANISM="Bigelowiella longifila, Strain CCMP242" /LENGTH=248 /DNA_ID=CAMNT_0027857149 /DNA_START=23 /DNA_END=766 /DNA_ORIENTATION=-